MQSMTGFGSKEGRVAVGKISVELRSTNHKSLEIVFHLPEGFLSLEERMKKEIEARVKRGRVICAVNISGGQPGRVSINGELLKGYLSAFKKTKRQFQLKGEPSFDTLVHLPGVLTLEDKRAMAKQSWPALKIFVDVALDGLVKTRSKEGKALFSYLKSRAQGLADSLDDIRSRFKKVVKDKLVKINTDEERASFLKNTDISEEIERLAFHIRNFSDVISKRGPIGKELDFIAQEMQREANTMGAKSCDALISAKVIQTKSQIEKIREQAQNIE